MLLRILSSVLLIYTFDRRVNELKYRNKFLLNRCRKSFQSSVTLQDMCGCT